MLDLLSLLLAFIGPNLYWYFHSKRKEEEHKRVCGVYDRIVSIREKEIEILKGYMDDVCSGDINREENAKYEHRFKSGWQGNDAWIKNQDSDELICEGNKFIESTKPKNTIVLFDRSLLRDGVTSEELGEKIAIVNK